ncbi:MAG: multicopper oxidase domain-containing protein [Actinomycetota bacterium]
MNRMRHFFFPSLLLAAGVIAWESVLHSSVFGHAKAGGVGHVARDVMLAWPLAFAALTAGPRVAGRLFGNKRRLARAASSVLLLFMMLIPAVTIHGMIDARLASVHEHVNAAPTIGGWDVLAHGVRDAGLALVVAFPLAWITAGMKRRRHVHARLVAVAISMLVVGLPGIVARAATFETPLSIPPVLTDQDISITMKQADVQVFPAPAPKTKMWTYNGIFPGPTIRRPSGTPTHVTFINDLPEETGEMTVHHHGNHSASSEDGQPDDELISPGGSRTYPYEFMEGGKPERAAFQWYHDHRMDHTGRNVWMGLAGMFILDDEVDAALPLPKGEYDVPLMITDRKFDQNNQLVYELDGGGTLGDTILVNGAPTPYFEVADRTYRLRILNASNLREYGLELGNGQEMIQVASESGLLPAPVTRKRIVLGPAERVEIVVDFAGRLGEDIVLRNTAVPLRALPVSPAETPREIMQFRVRRVVADDSFIPSTLRPMPAFEEPSVTRTWILGEIPLVGKLTRPDNTDFPFWVLWTINGRPFDPGRIDAKPRLGTSERWRFINRSALQHRIHIHDVDWKVVWRIGGLGEGDQLDPEAAGVETGLRETFLVRSDEIVEVVSRPFADHLGTYMFHCHILEHEDTGMMAQFQVVR